MTPTPSVLSEQEETYCAHLSLGLQPHIAREDQVNFVRHILLKAKRAGCDLRKVYDAGTLFWRNRGYPVPPYEEVAPPSEPTTTK